MKKFLTILFAMTTLFLFANNENNKVSKKNTNVVKTTNVTKIKTIKKSDKKAKPLCNIFYRDYWVTGSDGSTTKETVMVIINCETGVAY